MIELKFTGICENCPNADLALRSVEGFERTYWYVDCIHQEIFKKWLDRMQKTFIEKKEET